MCGNAWLLSLYKYDLESLPGCSSTSACTPATPANSTTGINETLTVPSATSTISSTALPVSSPTPTYVTHEDLLDLSEWYFMGCAVDSNNRILSGYSQTSDSNLTIDECLSMCDEKGYTFAGVEYGEECYCGSSVPTSITYSDTACNVACTGESTEICGGGWALDLYELVSATNVTSCTTDEAYSSLTVGNAFAIPTAVPVSIGATPTTASVTRSSTVSVAGYAQTTAADSTSVPSSLDTHNVWAHFMVGNTYPYAGSDWLSDINAASSYGIDGFALNMGSDSWQPARIADAYSAVSQSGTQFKLFLSLDMTSLSCSSASDAQNLVNMVKTYASNPSQAMHNGKVLVSTFAGSDCTFGTGSSNGWQTAFVQALNAQGVDIFFVPSLFSDITTFASNTWMDGELNWNSGWPTGDADLSTASDVAYAAALGSKEYMPAISPFFFTHFGVDSWNKNWLWRGDDWLYCTRWEQIISMRESVKMTEILTWNDYGESSYIGPVEGALPAGSDVWVDGFDHDGINVLTKYYATAFKTGSYPAITKDTIVMWSRPHPHDATASDDSVGKPTGWDSTEDYLYAVILSQADAIVTLTSGSFSQSFSVSTGLTKLKMPSSTGSISGQISRSNSVVASYHAGSAFYYTESPKTYNYNYIVGSSS